MRLKQETENRTANRAKSKTESTISREEILHRRGSNPPEIPEVVEEKNSEKT